MKSSDRREITIIDYGAGNLRSVANAVIKLGYEPVVTGNPDKVLAARIVILPGVGAAADTVHSLRELGMEAVIRRLVREKRPLLAICVGLQVMLSETEEGGRHPCFGIVPGRVKRLPEGQKVPHMGWNQVKQRTSHPIFQGIPDEANFYFAHSYYADPSDTSAVAGTTDCGASICSVLIKDNLVATQFHPEKSGDYGLRIYTNFLRLAEQSQPERRTRQ
ncbi:MAG TPA: imidazole glycerol phosphate synthase subunit HisH [Dehalococcoidia bacterium]|nr:imidazole glycerol phosphate synthase subunit HisH [Dehalococcoidia bacterium]